MMYKIQFAKLMFYDNFNKQTWFLILLLTMLLCQKNEQNKLFDQHRLHCTLQSFEKYGTIFDHKRVMELCNKICQPSLVQIISN